MDEGPESLLNEVPVKNGQIEADRSSDVEKVSKQKLLEEKRRFLQEERLRKQREMEALLAEEEALLKAAEDGLDNEQQPAQEANADTQQEHMDDMRMDDMEDKLDDSYSGGENGGPGRDEDYEVRSELGSQEEMADEEDSEQMIVHGSEEELDKPSGEEKEDDVERHEPPVEGGLAGLDDGEEEDFEDIMEGDAEGETDTQNIENESKRPISPVTWDVDVHANEDNLSVDSPIHSTAGDESDGEQEDEKKESGEKKESFSSKDDTKSPKALTTSKSTDKTCIEEAEALRPRIHKYLYREAKYFMVKSSNHENVRLAKAKGVWSTPPQNEIRFNKAIDENTTVILVFSVKESGAFQGFARINGPSQKDGPKINWVLPPGISAKALSGVFRLDWISRTDLSFPKTMHLRNPWNLNKPVKIARDGQEIEPHSGEELCKLFTLDGSSDYERVISRVKRKRESLQARGIANKSSTRTPVPSYDRNNDSRSRGRGNYRGGLRSASSYSRGPPAQYHSRSHHSSNPPPLMGYNATTHDSHNYIRNSYSYNRSGGGSSSHRSNYPPAHLYSQTSNQYPSGYSDMFVKSSYEEYLESMKRAGSFLHDTPSMSMGGHYSSYGGSSGRSGLPPPPIPSYSSSRDRDRDRGRTNPDRYERDVEDFLRRTSGTSGSRSYSHRSESGSHRSASDRYKEYHESRSDHRRGRDRSRSRDRDRSYRERR